MRDAVAEILAERAAQGGRGAGALAASVLLHGLLIAAAVYAALHQPPIERASVLNIRFAPMRQPAPVVQRTAEARPKPATPRIEAPKPLQEKPAAKPAEKNTVPLSTFGRSTKKGSENPETRTPTTDNRQPATGPAAAVGEVAIGAAGVTGLEGGDFPYTLYIDRMQTLIGRHWLRPQAAPGQTVTVFFAVNRDGSIRDAAIETPSGNATFDRAALRAVMESSPLPPLPFAYSGTYLGVHLTFR